MAAWAAGCGAAQGGQDDKSAIRPSRVGEPAVHDRSSERLTSKPGAP